MLSFDATHIELQCRATGMISTHIGSFHIGTGIVVAQIEIAVEVAEEGTARSRRTVRRVEGAVGVCV